MSTQPSRRRRLRFGYANVAATTALVLAISGGALAAGHYLITSVHQISPKVVKALRGHRGPRGPAGQRGPQGSTGATGPQGVSGTNGTNGTNGQGPAIAVHDDNLIPTSSNTDTSFHSVATLTIPAAGSYAAVAKVMAGVTTGGSGVAVSECDLTAHTTSGADPDTLDRADTTLNFSQDIFQAMLPLAVVHSFSGPGTFTLACAQSGLTGGGANLYWNNARVVATQATSVSDTAVTS